jgi:serine/threonine-protein kinase
MAEGRFDEACPKLARSNALDPEVGTKMNLARCYEEIGRTASAYSTWKAAADAAGQQKSVEADESDRRKQADREAFARSRITALESHLLHVTLSVVGAERAALAVSLDGEPVPPDQWGVQLPVDPGDHGVEAQAPGRRPWFAQFEVTEDRAPCVTVVIPVLEVSPMAAPQPPDHDANAGTWMRPAAVAIGSASVVLGVLGAGFGIAAIQAHSRAVGDCIHTPNCSETRNRDLGDLSTDATASDVAFVAAGVGLVASAVLWWAAPQPSSRGLAVRPIVGPGQAGLVVAEVW